MSKPLPPNQEQLLDPDPSIRGSRRRMTIYYNVNQEPDVGLPLAQLGTIDIADPIKQRYVEVLSQQTVDAQNQIPIANSRIDGDFGTTVDEQQKQYASINEENNVGGIQDVNKIFFYRPSQFNFAGTDKKGVSESQQEYTRTFQVNKYFKNINTNPAEHGALIDAQLLSTTGFNSLESNKFVVVGGTQEKPDDLLKIGPIYYNKKGAYKNTSFVGQPTLNGSTVTATSMSLERMKKIGLNILYDAVQAGSGPDHDPTGTANGFSAAEVNMGLPSLPRIGKKVRLSRFSPTHEAKKLFGVEKPNNPSFIDNEMGENPTMTYGNIYNPFAQFNSLVSLGQIAVCVVMILAFIVLLEIIVAFSSIPTRSGPTRYEPQQPNHSNNRLLGASTDTDLPPYPTDGMSGSEFLQQFLGIKGLFSYTFHNFNQCLQSGLQEFFGIPRGASVGAAFATGVLKILVENGRLNVVLREITRNGIDTIMGSDLTSGGPYSIEAVGNLIKKIRDSKILGFINVLSQIGDKVEWERSLQGTNPKIGSNVSVINNMSETSREFIIAKSRLSTGKLAWGNFNSPMLHLPLTSLFVSGVDNRPRLESGISNIDNNRSVNTKLMNSTGDEHIKRNLENSLGINGSFPTSNRLSRQLVELMEEQLEADYMPFYVQDLRTNEILSFHAFLEEASEDFSIEYTQQDGYGRMDKVQIYKGTTRKINVSFKMVATNDEDHEMMWYKINRLAMTIYPQWTQGREVNVGGIKFIQPFSQIPGATPVIRLRLGDLWRSNYSKQSIARLFGATTREDFNIYGSSTFHPPPISPEEQQRLAENEQKIQKILNFGLLTGDTSVFTESSNRLNLNDVLIRDRSKIYLKGGAYSARLREYFEPLTGQQQLNLTDNQLIVCTYAATTQASSNTNRRGSHDVPAKVILSVEKIITTNPLTSTNLVLKTGKHNPIEFRIDTLGNNIDRTLTADDLRSELRDNTTTTADTERNAGIEYLIPRQFFDDNRNPILRSFKSTHGKGLAGVVTEFKVDYAEAKSSWETTRTNHARAPKFVTITLGMQVIHDIPLGLDANGIMNAPIWPVGRYSRDISGISDPSPSLALDPEEIPAVINRNRGGGDLGQFDPLYNPLINRG